MGGIRDVIAGLEQGLENYNTSKDYYLQQKNAKEDRVYQQQQRVIQATLQARQLKDLSDQDAAKAQMRQLWAGASTRPGTFNRDALTRALSFGDSGHFPMGNVPATPASRTSPYGFTVSDGMTPAPSLAGSSTGVGASPVAPEDRGRRLLEMMTASDFAQKNPELADQMGIPGLTAAIDALDAKKKEDKLVDIGHSLYPDDPEAASVFYQTGGNKQISDATYVQNTVETLRPELIKAGLSDSRITLMKHLANLESVDSSLGRMNFAKSVGALVDGNFGLDGEKVKNYIINSPDPLNESLGFLSHVIDYSAQAGRDPNLPASVDEFNYGKTHPDFAASQLANSPRGKSARDSIYQGVIAKYATDNMTKDAKGEPAPPAGVIETYDARHPYNVTDPDLDTQLQAETDKRFDIWLSTQVGGKPKGEATVSPGALSIVDSWGKPVTQSAIDGQLQGPVGIPVNGRSSDVPKSALDRIAVGQSNRNKALKKLRGIRLPRSAPASASFPPSGG